MWCHGPGTPSATPMLTVRVSISPSMATRSRSVACSRMASASAASAVHRRRRDDDELVATEAGDQVGPLGTFSQSFGEDADEPVAGGVAEIVVDRLQPVQVEEQRRDGPGLAAAQSRSRCASSARRLLQAGQVVVLGEIAQLVLGDDARLQLGEQRGDRLERVELFGRPLPVAELDEAEHAGRDVAGQQRHHRHRRRGDVATFLDRALVVVGGRLRAEDEDLFLRVSAAAKTGSASAKYTTAERIRVGDVRAGPATRRPASSRGSRDRCGAGS